MARHAEELNERKQEEATLIQECREHAQAQLKAFFAAQEEEVKENELKTAKRQQELEAEIKALEDNEQKMDWILVRDIVDRVLRVTALEMETSQGSPSAPSSIEVEAARKNLDRLVKLAVTHQSSQGADRRGGGNAGVVPPATAQLVDAELIL